MKMIKVIMVIVVCSIVGQRIEAGGKDFHNGLLGNVKPVQYTSLGVYFVGLILVQLRNQLNNKIEIEQAALDDIEDQESDEYREHQMNLISLVKQRKALLIAGALAIATGAIGYFSPYISLAAGKAGLYGDAAKQQLRDHEFITSNFEYIR